VARVGHNAKILPGCEIVVPTKPENNGKTLTQWLSVGTTMAGLATLIATIANLMK
jgi:putative polysaccharide biosynthesis protein